MNKGALLENVNKEQYISYISSECEQGESYPNNNIRQGRS